MKVYYSAFLLLVLFLVHPKMVYPQWVPSASPDASHFTVFNSTYLFADAGEEGVYRYNLKNWSLLNNGITGYIFCMTISGNNIFAGGNGLFRSTNFGTNWTSVNNGLTDSADVYCLTSIGTNIFAGTFFGGVFISTNNGDLWTPVNNGLPSASLIQFAVNGTNLFAAMGNGSVYLSTDYGTNWIEKSNGLDGGVAISTIASYGTNMLLGSGQGVSISTDYGDNWTQINNGLIDAGYIRCFAVYNNTIFAGIQGDGFFYSTNSGADWIQDNNGISGLNSMDMHCLAIMGSNIIIGGYYQIWKRPLSQVTSAANDIISTPHEYSLNQNYPNPFNPNTKISYSLKENGHVKIMVYDVLGSLVRVLVDETKEPGNYETDFNAKGLASGVYLYKIDVTGKNNVSIFSGLKKALLLK